uniref:Lysosomal membrane ascorbate-dependent ferrireductase CYB561A3 n=1 Tax=Sphaeramia orbicularis TaxID=375764 RepID=A0A672YUK3_9TELE
MLKRCVFSAGAVLYRVPLTWGQNKLPWKLLHASLMLLAFILSVVGLCAVFDFHNAKNTPNLYSLHSWIGISAVALFALQVLHFNFSNTFTLHQRKLLCQINIGPENFGHLLLCFKLFFVLASYGQLPPEALLANSLGVLIVAFGLVVLKILSNPKWQRPDSRPENGVLDFEL